MNRTRRAKCTDCSQCFYCSMPIGAGAMHEHDHFPTPFRHDGAQTVSACTNCHNLKDRVALKNWPEDAIARGFAEMGPVGRLLCAKLLMLAHDMEGRAA